MNWAQQLQEILLHEPCVVVTMNLILGSAPRESGCRMMVTQEGIFGSIGGGNLEYTAILKAREWLHHSSTSKQMHMPYGLGPALNQCCGGAVTLHFERFPAECPGWLSKLATDVDQRIPTVLVMAIDRLKPLHFLIGENESQAEAIPHDVWKSAWALLHDNNNAKQVGDGQEGDKRQSLTELVVADEKWWIQPMLRPLHPLVLFGAGHVGQEVARLLHRLPFEVTWVDSRPDVLTEYSADNIHPVNSPQPVQEVATAAAGTIFVVMTHSHQLDEDICFEILRRGDFSWLGLIGSQTKRRRFVQRLNKRGLAEDQLLRLTCPIGLNDIKGKQPATIALSLVAQIMMEKPWTHVNN